MPPEGSGGARAYREEGDPRWRIWWDAMPGEDLRLIAETVKRFLDSTGRPLRHRGSREFDSRRRASQSSLWNRR